MSAIKQTRIYLGAVALVLVGFFWNTENGLAEPITVTNVKGQSMTVEMLRYAPATGIMKIQRTSDKQVFDVALKLFDEESQKKMLKAAPEAKPKLEIKVSNGKRRKRQSNSSYMKNQEITTSIHITNESREAALKDGKITIFLVGRTTERYVNRSADGAKILSKQTFKATIPEDGEFKYECKSIITSYDSDRDSSNIGGWEYDGYLLVVHTKDGELLTTTSNLANVERETLKDPEKLKIALSQPEGALVERNLLPHARGTTLR